MDKAYVRCLRILMSGKGYPMVATHDDRMISITELFADRYGRSRATTSIQMLYGIRTDRQEALAGAGHTVRVYVPYGDDWYGYFMRRLAERPANVAFFLRALGAKSKWTPSATCRFPRNEPVYGYAPGSAERAALEKRIKELAGEPRST